jgi:hypothetical protein
VRKERRRQDERSGCRYEDALVERSQRLGTHDRIRCWSSTPILQIQDLSLDADI